MYDEESGLVKLVTIPRDVYPFDFAWAPGRDAFVVTHLEGVTFFQKDASGHGYTIQKIRCPTDALYMYCSWSPDGEWLAVTCPDRKRIGSCKLGLFRFGDKKLIRTSLGIGRYVVAWEHDGLLYAMNDNSILTIELKDGEPRAVRTIPLKFIGEFGFFY